MRLELVGLGWAGLGWIGLLLAASPQPTNLLPG